MLPWAAQDLARKARADARSDARVDLVLFFISPLGLRPTDLAAMRRLGRRAPVLPVVARARSLPSQSLPCMRVGRTWRRCFPCKVAPGRAAGCSRAPAAPCCCAAVRQGRTAS
jgi:hypothetical protein